MKTPIKIKEKPIVYFDVDDTLVMWPIGGQPPAGKENEYITIHDSYGDVLVKPHKEHIELMKQFAARDHTVVVWSQGGADWAETVVKKLNLEKYVDLIITKPIWYVDDLPSSTFMPDSIRIYKQQ